MRIAIDREKCQGNGLCEQIAADIYQLNDDGELLLLHGDTIPAGLEGQAEAGASACPVAALSVGR